MDIFFVIVFLVILSTLGSLIATIWHSLCKFHRRGSSLLPVFRQYSPMSDPMGEYLDYAEAVRNPDAEALK